MFCPKCATQNVDGASFCRVCGANISLVPQALSGQIAAPPSEREDRHRPRKRRREPSVEEAIRSIVMGIAFVVVSILVMEYAPAGRIWWFWMLIPAGGSLARGLAELARLKAHQRAQPYSQPQMNAVRPAEIPAPQTGELRPPVPSVTEGTTRHLGAEPQTRPFEFSDTQKPS
jgi:hypothetical protein